MDENFIFCADVGSTWTKSCLFRRELKKISLEYRTDAPTTRSDLYRGFSACLDSVLTHTGVKIKPMLLASSSAKGGLSIAASGLVPELTMKAAREAACTAGGKVVRSFHGVFGSYDIEEINTLAPDIFLFTGGTDGGNRTMVLENAEKLKKLKKNIVIIYAGNNTCAGEVHAILKKHTCITVKNVFPELNRLDVSGASAAIQEIFISKIALGKGLGKIIKKLNADLLPTPLSIFNFAAHISRHMRALAPFMIIDPGGATTDVYSASPAAAGNENIVFRGLPEPFIKRTVEGGAGLHANAENALLSAQIKNEICLDYARRLKNTSVINTTAINTAGNRHEENMLRIIATACVSEAVRRHTGKMHSYNSVNGQVRVQSGKDLRLISTVILSGGFLSRIKDQEIFIEALRNARAHPENDPGCELLLPEAPRVYTDTEYLLPLCALVSQKYPADAVQYFSDHLTDSEINEIKNTDNNYISGACQNEYQSAAV